MLPDGHASTLGAFRCRQHGERVTVSVTADMQERQKRTKKSGMLRKVELAPAVRQRSAANFSCNKRWKEPFN